MKEFYEWADSDNLKLPITIHSQYVSLQNVDLEEGKAAEYNEVDVNGWIKILNNYGNIRINFAHMGGIEFAYDDEKIKKYIPIIKRKNLQTKKKYSMENRKNIIYLMNNRNVFADVSALNPMTGDDKDLIVDNYFFNVLNQNLNSNNEQIMFGTDTPATTISHLDNEVFDVYKKNIKSNYHQNFFSKNALGFLFGEPDDNSGKYKIPDTYNAFIEAMKMIFNYSLQKPGWVK